MIGGQRHDVSIASDERVQTTQQRPDRLIEVRVHVLHFLAVGTERVADQVGARETDGEHVGARVTAKLHRFDERGGEAAKVGVGERAALPLGAKGRVRSLAAAFEHVRECRGPAARRRFARRIVRMTVVRWRKETLPRASVVGVHRMIREVGSYGRRRAIAEHRRGFPAVERLAEPGRRVGAVSSEHDGAAILERQCHDVSAAFSSHEIGERRHGELMRAVAAFHRLAVADVVRVAVGRTGHLAPGVAIPPGILNDAVRAWKRSRRHRRMTGARHGRQVRIGRAPEPGAARDHPLETAGPFRLKPIDVIGAHLIHDEQHRQFWRRPAGEPQSRRDRARLVR